jgi:hypothetical protein
VDVHVLGGFGVGLKKGANLCVPACAVLCPAGEYCRSVLYNAATDELYYPAGSMVVALAAANSSAAAAAAADSTNAPQQQQQQQRRQRFFMGHSGFVCCMALGGQGTLLATGQEGRQPLIRLWDCSRGSQQQERGGAVGKCLTILCGEC